MAFSNPILGNEVLVRTAMQSEGFAIDAENQISGWRFERDGTAFLTNVSVGNTNFNIDENGNASFNDLSVNGELFYQGVPIEEILAAFPKGIRYYGALDTLIAQSNSATEFMFMEVDTFLENGRMYRIATSTLLINGPTAAIATVRLRDGGASSPTSASNLLARANVSITVNGTAGQNDTRLEYVFSVNDAVDIGIENLHSGEHRLGLSIARPVGTGTGNVSLSTSNNTINPVTLYVEDLGPLVQNTAQEFQSGGGGGNPVVQTFTTTYNATWSRAWDASLNVMATNGEIRQGYYSSAQGNQRSWVGFDYDQIQDDLTGAEVIKTEFYLYYDHWYANSGGTAIIGTHNSTATSAPSYNGDLDDQDRKRVDFNINQGKWVDMTSVVGTEFKTGASTGICIGIGPTTSHEYYGKARGNTETNEPKIRITYKK